MGNPQRKDKEDERWSLLIATIDHGFDRLVASIEPKVYTAEEIKKEPEFKEGETCL